MTKLIVLSFITLDGVMQAPGGPEEDPTGGFKYGGWVAGYFDDFLGNVIEIWEDLKGVVAISHSFLYSKNFVD